MLRNRGVVLSVVGALYGLSAMGDQMALIALTLRLHDQGRSGLAISALVIAGVLPLVVVGPLAAPLVDRVESGRLIVVVTALQAVLGLGLAFVTDVMVCIGLLALLGAGLAVVSPALLLLVPEILGEENAARGYARLETFRSAGNVVGPVLAGLLIAAYGDRVALLCDAATFAAMAVAFLALRLRRRPVAGTNVNWLAQVREGVGVLGADRLLRTAIAALSAAILFTAVLSVARVFFIRDDLGASDTGYGVLVTAHTVGMLLTSALIAPRIPVTWQPRVLAGSGVLMGVALAVSSGVPVFAVTLGAFVLTGAANSLQALAIRNLIHARVPADVRGRAFASSGAALNGANLAGTALGGPAVSLLGGAGALALAGIGTLVVSVAGAPVLLRGQSDAQRTPTEVGRTSTEAGRPPTTDTDRPVGPARD
ncbi:MFS transporter [Streptomyces sp. NPDC001834]|uniref:MFS transporter n=1 Tax=Streptomyces sp. NPDC001834 TaxID=3364616 RepID=UPI0036BD49A1